MNPLGDLGARRLSDGLRYNRTLETLCLNMCCIGNRGFAFLLAEMGGCYSLRTVKVRFWQDSC